MQVDGADVAVENYEATAESGTVTLNLKKSYLDSLSPGSHDLTLLFEGDKCATRFTIAVPVANATALQNAATNGGSVYLENDITCKLEIGQNKTLDLSLNGHDLKMPQSGGGPVITINQGATLNLYDSNGPERYGHWSANGKMYTIEETTPT